jgi:hypothetical protein
MERLNPARTLPMSKPTPLFGDLPLDRAPRRTAAERYREPTIMDYLADLPPAATALRYLDTLYDGWPISAIVAEGDGDFAALREEVRAIALSDAAMSSDLRSVTAATIRSTLPCTDATEVVEVMGDDGRLALAALSALDAEG